LDATLIARAQAFITHSNGPTGPRPDPDGPSGFGWRKTRAKDRYRRPNLLLTLWNRLKGGLRPAARR
jgi:hypothetical protein